MDELRRIWITRDWGEALGWLGVIAGIVIAYVLYVGLWALVWPD